MSEVSAPEGSAPEASPDNPGDIAAIIPDVTVPAGLTLAGLVAGMAAGLALAGSAAAPGVLAVAGPIGGLWLRALQMTIIPLVASLLVIGVVQTVAAAQAGRMARRTLGLFAAILAGGTLAAAVLVPMLLDLFPVPTRAAEALRGGPKTVAAVPTLADFLAALVPTNVLDAAARDAVLPTILFFGLFAVAITRLPPAPRALLFNLFAALAGAMMVIIGWVLRLAPIGVFALALGVAARSGGDAIAALAHYIALVASMGGLVLLAASWGWAGLPARCCRCRRWRCPPNHRWRACRRCWARAGRWASVRPARNLCCRWRWRCSARPARR